MTRRDLLKHFGTMTAAAVALPMLDLDKLVWTPKPIIVVPALPPRLFWGPIQTWVADPHYAIGLVVNYENKWVEVELSPLTKSLLAAGIPIAIGS